MSETLKVLIVEDEMIIAESISDMLEDLGYEVTNICIRATSALEKIKQSTPDLALFDINLKGDEDGIWLANQLMGLQQFPFIFLTSYGDRKTVDLAIETSPYGYLIKPIEKESLYGAIEVAMKRYSELSQSSVDQSFVARDYFFVKENYQYVKISLKEILYIKSDDNYLEIHVDGNRHIIRSTLKDFEQQLPASDFIRIHRSFLVNKEKITSFSPVAVFIEKEKLPISKKYSEALSAGFKTMG